MSSSDQTDGPDVRCPHGWTGPWYSRPCGCRLTELPYSEVCMHMRVAGRTMWVRTVSPWMAQIIADDGRPFGAPITRGEAGLS